MAFIFILEIIGTAFLYLIPVIEFKIPDEMMEMVSNAFHGLGYIIPIKALIPLAMLFITLDLHNLVVKIVWRVKSFIPTMGK